MAGAAFALVAAFGICVSPSPAAELADDDGAPPGLVLREFIFETAPFAQCHASTIAETKEGLVAAWFGGTREKNPDVEIWLSRNVDGRWTEPVSVGTGVRSEKLRYPCWNPVLFAAPDGKLLLFFKVGPSPSTWWGMLTTSDDGGRTFGEAKRLPEGIAGPIKNKPVLLADGRLLCGSSSEDDGWRVHMETTSDWGNTWSRTDVLNDGRKVRAIQPTILLHSPDELQILCRNGGGNRILTAHSNDAGKTWSKLEPTELPNPNSGIDAVTLADGRHLLVYNHTTRGRTPLNVAVSSDGKEWQAALALETEPGEYSYPAVIQTSDGLVHVTYTWKRVRVRHVVLDPTRLQLSPIRDGAWPQ